MRQLANPDPLRRPLFFDPVMVESPRPGVPCDHLRQSRPEAIAGNGWVVLMESAAPAARTLRFWLPPPTDENRPPLEQALGFAKDVGATDTLRIIAARKFAWCR